MNLLQHGQMLLILLDAHQFVALEYLGALGLLRRLCPRNTPHFIDGADARRLDAAEKRPGRASQLVPAREGELARVSRSADQACV